MRSHNWLGERGNWRGGTAEYSALLTVQCKRNVEKDVSQKQSLTLRRTKQGETWRQGLSLTALTCPRTAGAGGFHSCGETQKRDQLKRWGRLIPQRWVLLYCGSGLLLKRVWTPALQPQQGSALTTDCTLDGSCFKCSFWVSGMPGGGAGAFLRSWLMQALTVKSLYTQHKIK